ECKAPSNQDNKNKEKSERSMPVETSASTTLVSCDFLGGYNWSGQAEEGPNYALMAFSSLNSDSELVSQLELLEEKLSQDDVNQKLLRSLSPEWNTHVVVWRNKADLDTMSMDDLNNNIKVYELEVKEMSSSSLSTQNMAFMSSLNNNTSSTNGTVNTAHEAEEGPNYALMAFSSLNSDSEVKDYQEKDKIRSKPDKNGKCGEARKSRKKLQ
nr:ribonuclease H-like domain-containing protein [Tanacetum cinerariifolium]